ncbi:MULTISPECIES: type III secretion system inner membrane ring lipoprotein SctJ [Bradyrhizobium]|uniref:Lipoprotein n=3 Tax=Bradyrhizobium TaxID=374 RepID=A0AAE5X8E7_9BRAD|nr:MULTISPECIES: type III secretion inner membrane ring lipoprotein SctJ [Bradyrhizobium]MCG2632872.1 type III secretion inner membrane ring lipoprotein SctJ [Bradyrhizobium zhengyangense]MCG2645485.1 type III secretion inner membrane ring lipoprotein SctJ [Bradyrhizobium zhengyangense]MCG2673044.1 type III secretion inner membrane ring lipoprotein SctJ [Bradyrhizobium zhengyangense]MDN4984429.1 type III secretion inner membrane ring lipoprotein SctJ [Bradyrhizobium sp. WYCCWR 13022]MDN5002422
MVLFAQRKIGRGATSGRQVHAVLLLPLVLLLAGCKADLYTKVQEREANEMLALLLSKGVDAVRVVAKDGSSTIQVEEKQLAVSIELLNGQGLPRQVFKNLGEVFKGSGLVASPVEERARYVYALSEELSRTINDIDGVLSARVHVVLPKNDLLRQDATPSSASVFIRHGSNANLSALLPQIKMLVANGIEGLSYDKVAVVFVPVERAQHEMFSAPAAASIHPTKFTSATFLAIVVGGVGAAVGILSYVLLSTRVRQLGQFWRKVPNIDTAASMPAVLAAGKKRNSDAR